MLNNTLQTTENSCFKNKLFSTHNNVIWFNDTVKLAWDL